MKFLPLLPFMLAFVSCENTVTSFSSVSSNVFTFDITQTYEKYSKVCNAKLTLTFSEEDNNCTYYIFSENWDYPEGGFKNEQGRLINIYTSTISLEDKIGNELYEFYLGANYTGNHKTKKGLVTPKNGKEKLGKLTLSKLKRTEKVILKFRRHVNLFSNDLLPQKP